MSFVRHVTNVIFWKQELVVLGNLLTILVSKGRNLYWLIVLEAVRLRIQHVEVLFVSCFKSQLSHIEVFLLTSLLYQRQFPIGKKLLFAFNYLSLSFSLNLHAFSTKFRVFVLRSLVL